MAKVQKITGFRLSEINIILEFIIRKHTLEHENYMLQELNMAKKGMARSTPESDARFGNGKQNKYGTGLR